MGCGYCHGGRDGSERHRGESAIAPRLGCEPHAFATDHRLPFQQENSLRYGELTDCPAFSDDEARQVAWVLHRDRLLQHCSGGKRPAGWWDYDSPVPYPRDSDYAEATLYEAELLVESEVTELMARWRSEFERAQDPGFMFCGGAIWLKGEAARKAHLKWAGVPRALILEVDVATPAPEQDRPQARRAGARRATGTGPPDKRKSPTMFSWGSEQQSCSF